MIININEGAGYSKAIFFVSHYRTLTLRLLGDGHAQPLQVDTVLAADTGGPAAEGMEGDGPNDQWQLQTQFGCPRNINTNLVRGTNF